MSATVERLLGLTVGDVMTRNVYPISESLSMAEVAKILCEHNISGAPVVDAAGSCVGVIDSSDFVRRERQIGEDQPLASGGADRNVDVSEDRVSTFMTKELRTISPEAPLMEAAQQMSMEHIRRLPVVDSAGKPIGILTTTDLVAVIVNIVDEVRTQGQ